MATPIPSLAQQKAVILRNAHVFDRAMKVGILSLVLMETGGDEDEAGEQRIATPSGKGGANTDIDLNALGEQWPAVVNRIYNMVEARLRFLSQPAPQ